MAQGGPGFCFITSSWSFLAFREGRRERRQPARWDWGQPASGSLSCGEHSVLSFGRQTLSPETYWLLGLPSRERPRPQRAPKGPCAQLSASQ